MFHARPHASGEGAAVRDHPAGMARGGPVDQLGATVTERILPPCSHAAIPTLMSLWMLPPRFPSYRGDCTMVGSVAERVGG